MIQMIRTSWNAATGLVLFAFLAACPFSLSAQQMSGQTPGANEQMPMQQANCSTPAAVFDPACVGLRNQNSALVPDSTSRPANEPQFDFSSEERQQRLDESAGRTTAMPSAQPVPVRQLPPEPPTDFQKFVESSIGQMLPLYGAQLFVDAPSTFAPVDQIPVTNDYVIGPGDELLVRAWGSITFNLRRTVDRNGYIYIPNIGQIQVSRLRFSEVHDFLQAQIGRVFQRFQLSVEMGRLRSVQVFVVGKARRPGTYTVSSLSTVVSTLFAAGGPSAAGSMRSIQLKRNGQVAAEVDLYNLLLKGDKAADIAILPGDIIYIPPAGPRVALAGSVSEPAIYEVKKGEDLGGLLEMEGGLTSLATEQFAQMERFDKQSGRHIEDVRLDDSGLKKQLQDGDILWVRSMVPRFNDAVTLRGNVANPGRYAWKPGMHLRDLIPNQEILLTRQYWQQHNKLGVPSPKPDPTMADTDTAKTQPAPDQPLQPSQHVASVAASSSYYDDKDAKDKPMIAGLTSKTSVGTQVPAIDWDYAVIERLNKKDLSSSLIPFHLGKLLLQGDESENLELHPGDIVTIFSQADVLVPQQRQRKLVRLEGEFQSSGVYSARPGETLRQLVARAGGLTPEAYLYGSSFARESTRMQQQARLDDYATRLEQDIQRAGANKSGSVISPAEAAVTAATIESQRELIAKMRQLRATGRIVLEMSPTAHNLADIPDIPVEDGDVFVVPSVPTNVSVIGAVYDQNSFLFNSTAKASDYLSLAGGYTRNADQSHIFVIRADGSVFSRNAKTRHQGSVENAKLNPGDAVVVPERINKSTLLRGLTDWSSIFSQFALGAAAVNVIR